jgi:hypothetical protein
MRDDNMLKRLVGKPVAVTEPYEAISDDILLSVVLRGPAPVPVPADREVQPLRYPGGGQTSQDDASLQTLIGQGSFPNALQGVVDNSIIDGIMKGRLGQLAPAPLCVFDTASAPPVNQQPLQAVQDDAMTRRIFHTPGVRALDAQQTWQGAQDAAAVQRIMGSSGGFAAGARSDAEVIGALMGPPTARQLPLQSQVSVARPDAEMIRTLMGQAGHMASGLSLEARPFRETMGAARSDAEAMRTLMGQSADVDLAVLSQTPSALHREQPASLPSLSGSMRQVQAAMRTQQVRDANTLQGFMCEPSGNY